MLKSTRADSQLFKGMLIAHAVADAANVRHTSTGLAGWRSTGLSDHPEPWRAALHGRVLGQALLGELLQAYPPLGHWVAHPLPAVLAPEWANARAQRRRMDALFARFGVPFADPWAVLQALPVVSDDVDVALVIALGRAALKPLNPWLIQRCARMLPRLLAVACCNRPLCFVRHELWALVWDRFGEKADTADVQGWPRTPQAIDDAMRQWHELSLLALHSHLIPQVYGPQRAIFSRLFQGYSPQQRQQLLAAMRADLRPWNCEPLHRVDAAIRRAMARSNLKVAGA
ncbi:hypothetical protein [Pseudomonas fluorescens]|uniref:hypothetical protein n=1 Tax=Pseudomonas fluorescens TaxID=294 RepID=UPI001AA008E9|nr:hypothetical protein [Pseudomonas fluorescens]QTD31734.1 hypothetical protein JZM58_20915 [Pseudomonas fluorescens]